MCKIKNLSVQSASTSIYERMGRSKELDSSGTVRGCSAAGSQFVKFLPFKIFHGSLSTVSVLQSGYI